MYCTSFSHCQANFQIIKCCDLYLGKYVCFKLQSMRPFKLGIFTSTAILIGAKGILGLSSTGQMKNTGLTNQNFTCSVDKT